MAVLGISITATSLCAQVTQNRSAAADAPAIVLRGVVRHTDGRPIPGALVRATQYGYTLVALTTSDADGRFMMAAPERQLITLEVEAPIVRSAYGQLFATSDMGTVLVTLGDRTLPVDSTAAPQIIPVSGRALDTTRAVAMTREGDGRWRATVPSDREVLRYRVRYGPRQDTNTPDAGRIQSAADDPDIPAFVSVAPVVNGVATITVDPAKLPKDTTTSRITVSNRTSTAARLETIRDVSAALFKTSALSQKGDTAAARIAQDSIVRRTLRAFDAERDPIVRQAYANTLLMMFWHKLPQAEARRVARALDPRSPVAADFGYPMAITAALLAEEFPGRQGPKLAADTVYQHRVREVTSQALATPGISRWMRGRLYWQLAFTLGRESTSQPVALAYLDSLIALPETSEQEVRMLLREISPNRPTQVGKPIVPWVAVDLDDPKKQHKAADFAGKWTLIDLWGPWCAPCVAEMPALHDAHKMFGPRGLHIVSIDFEPSPDGARTFRKERYPMPWTNAWAGEEMFESAAARTFSTAAFPTILLVNPEGMIVAMDAELRGAKLAETLERLLPKTTNAVP
ncbi:MAG: redoxin domain-containing protein [Gemmatimonadaceae bacterium]|nr:redoxin domain-containing protein [Gemmatimonadaceae bacterium]